MKWNVFVPNTPLHLLYTSSILHYQERLNPALVLAIDDYGSVAAVVKCLGNIIGKNAELHRISGRNSVWGQLAGRLIRTSGRVQFALAKGLYLVPQILAMRKARQLLRNKDIHKLFLFDDTRPDAQSVMNIAIQHGVAEIIYVEDGIGAYAEDPVNVPTLKRQAQGILKLVFGKHFCVLDHHGAHPAVSSAILIHPDKAKSTLIVKRRAAMPPMAPFSKKDTHALIEAFGNFAEGIAELDQVALICIPHSEIITPRFKTMLFDLVQYNLRENIAVLIKYHPRELNGDFLELQPKAGVSIVDNTIPAELICAKLGDKLHTVYAELSTVLYTSKWINPHVETCLIGSAPLPEDLSNFLASVGVKHVLPGSVV